MCRRRCRPAWSLSMSRPARAECAEVAWTCAVEFIVARPAVVRCPLVGDVHRQVVLEHFIKPNHGKEYALCERRITQSWRTRPLTGRLPGACVPVAGAVAAGYSGLGFVGSG